MSDQPKRTSSAVGRNRRATPSPKGSDIAAAADANSGSGSGSKSGSRSIGSVAPTNGAAQGAVPNGAPKKRIPQKAGGQPIKMSDAIEAAQKLFNEGRISETWDRIRPMLSTPPRDPVLRSQLTYLQLGCALYYTGDLAAATRINAALPTNVWRPMRYRLSLRMRDPLTAKRLRSDPGVTDKERSDFRTTAGLYQLWAFRFHTGFPLYTQRHAAILFPKVLPTRTEHVPLPADPKQDEDNVVLEQGLGDVLYYLGHIKAEGHHETSRFIGLRKYGPLIARYFPDADYLPVDDLNDSHGRPRVHLAADFVGRGFARNGDPFPRATLDTTTRHDQEPPVWGICWRGGSGQNRREERHIPLQMFLDLLPRDGRYLALQFDLTDAERQILNADARVMVPLGDITANPIHTIDMIRPLAGVISVDSANWHMAGTAQVPFLAIMNKTHHWFWGADARAENAYASATTVSKDALTAGVVTDWMAVQRKGWTARKKLRRPKWRTSKPGPVQDRPVFVLGLPRSATSMTTRCLYQNGLWLGDTIAGNVENPQGYYESRNLRENLVKPTLRALGVDPLGVRSFPAWDVLPPFPDLRDRMLNAIAGEGYDNAGPWGFKDPKLTLIWPLLDRAFPNAVWVIVNRDRDKVLSSLCRTSFMARHSSSPEYWKPFCSAYDHRLALLRDSGAEVYEVDSDALSDGEIAQLRPILKAVGLKFDAKKTRAALQRD